MFNNTILQHPVAYHSLQINRTRAWLQQDTNIKKAAAIAVALKAHVHLMIAN
jgi:hypothetical protein